jgi:hypothetical protein
VPTANRPPADLAGRAGHRDRGQHRPRARHVDGAEGQAQHEAAVLAAHLALPDPGERALEQVLHLGEHHRDAEHDQYGQPRPADDVVGQRQRAQRERAEQREDAEADREARDHEVRPAPIGAGDGDLLRPPTLPGAGLLRPVGLHAAGQEHDRQYR